MAFLSPQDIINRIQGGSTRSLFSSSQPNTQNSSIPSPDSLLKKTQTQENAGGGKSFISNIAGKAKDLYLGIGKAIYNPLEEIAFNKGRYDVSPEITPKTVLDGTKLFGEGTVALAKGFNEGVVRILKSTSEQTIGKEATEKIADFGGPISLGKFSQDITGREKIASYQDISKRAKDYAFENNASQNEAEIFAGLTVLGALFVDNPLFGPGKGSVFKLGDDAILKMAKEESDDVIKDIIKAENPGLTNAELDAMAPAFREATTEQEVRTLSDQIRGIQNAPLDGARKGEPTPEEVLAISRENLRAPEATAKIPTGDLEPPASQYFRAIDDADNVVRYEPVDGQPIKIADDLDTFVHQPENGAYEVLESNTGRRIGDPAETPEAAIQSARQAVEGKTPEEIQDALTTGLQEGGPTPRAQSRIAPEASPEGTPASQQATPAAPRPFNQNFIRDVSRETEVGPMVERLQREFPELSEQAIAPIAKRLTHLKRTGDIEGILQVVRNINEDIKFSRGGRTTPSPEAFERSIAKVGPKEAVGDLPPSIGQLLTPGERGRYLANIQRVVKDSETAVIAQQEYDALWEHADQRVIDRYEELRVWRDIMRESVEKHPARGLTKYYGGKPVSDRTLSQVLEDAKGTDKKSANLDDIVTERGFADLDEAQKGLDEYLQSKQQLDEVEEELREVRPRARAARILQSMVEDVPVISRQQAGEIEALATPDDVRNLYKDISGFKGQALDVYRVFEQVFGENFGKVKKAILDPFDASKGEMVDEITTLGDRIEENIIKKYKIERSSKESTAVQLYGEGAITHEDLVKMVGSDRVEDVMAAAGWFRQEYDRLLDEVNAIREQIFPNDPDKLIPKRKEYFRHFQELSDGFRELIDIFETPAGIDPQLAGLSEWTKPKSKFLPFAQERLGKDSTIDAVGGFLNYAPTFAYAKHIDKHIGKFRYLRRRLAEVSPTPGTKEIRPTGEEALGPKSATGEQEVLGQGTELVKQEGINNFLTFLDDYANDLAGKTNPMDRYLQKVIPGGRRTMRALDFANNRVKANTILGNLSSSVSQIFNVPNGIATAKLYSLRGIEKTLGSIVAKDDNMARSVFLKERYQKDITSRFKSQWAAKPLVRGSQELKDFAVWITSALDEVGTKFIWQSHFAMAQDMIGKSVDGKMLWRGTEYTDPIKFADDIARKAVAGRGVGEVPLLQKSKVFKVVAPFQLEVTNAWWVLGDLRKSKDFGGIALLLVANYLMNEAAEEIRGSRVVFDPINSLIEGAISASDEMEQGNAGRAAYKFAGRQVGEILSNLPVGQTVAQAVPEDFVTDTLGLEGGKRELFGEGDPGRFGAGLLVMKGFDDPLYKLVPGFGGLQIKKTIEGVNAMIKGQVTDRGGNLSFKTEPTVGNVIQSILFGKNATSQAREFYSQRDDLFNRLYRQDAERTETRIDAEKYWADLKDLSREEKISKLKELDENDPTLADAVFKVAQDEAKGLDGTDRLIKILGVDNGERAKYISTLIENLDSREDQIKLLQDLDNKGLISDTVFEQLTVLLPDKIKPAE